MDAVTASYQVDNHLTHGLFGFERGLDGAWHTLGAGPGVGVNCAMYGLDGKLYVGLGAAPGVKVWDGASWATLGRGGQWCGQCAVLGRDEICTWAGVYHSGRRGGEPTGALGWRGVVCAGGGRHQYGVRAGVVAH